jgi:hypothetical protein
VVRHRKGRLIKMLYLSAEDNTLAPCVAEVHMQETEDLTIILPEGDEIYVSGNGQVFDNQGRELKIS